MGPKVGVLTEQGYFGEGYGFNEMTEEDKEKLEKEKETKDK